MTSRDGLCPLCSGLLVRGDAHPGTPPSLAGYPLLHCPACNHTCCPGAYGASVDYDALYGTEYQAQQIAPLRNPGQHSGLMLLPPYLKFAQVVGTGRGCSLLDIGCGAGRFLLVAQRLGWQARGIEPAPAAVEAAHSLGLPASTETPAELMSRAMSFDCVTLFDVLEHVAGPVGLVREAVALLKPGGELFVTVPNWDSPLMQQATRHDWLPPVHVQFFTPASLLKAVAAITPNMTVLSGVLSTDPAPPLSHPAAWLRWASRRLRGLPTHQAQLWLHGRQP